MAQELRQKFEWVDPKHLEIGDTILLLDGTGDLRTPYIIEGIVTDNLGSLCFKVRHARGDVVSRARYYFDDGKRVVPRKVE